MTVKKIVRYAFLLAIAILVNYIESLVVLPFVFPGVRLGLANAVGLLVLYYLGDKYYAGFGILRVVLTTLLLRGSLTGFLIALSGNALATIITLIIKRLKVCSIYGLSVVGAIFHGIGQVIMVAILYQTVYMFTYVIVLTISGIITGILVAYVSSLIVKRMPKLI